jgi:undecaprenyl-diphosphatase
MNAYLLSLILGIVEGLTEFLPVSSTAHLRLAEDLIKHILPLQNPADDAFWKMYTIVIQLGAILVLPIYFRNRIGKFLSTFPGGNRGDRNIFTHPLGLTMVAFVVTAGPAFLLTKQIGKNLDNPWVIAWALLIGGVVMWIVDAIYENRYSMERIEQMGLGQAIWIGLCQILSAVFPGTSRSMATIAAGQTAGLSRGGALEFSFFLSMPTMAAATLYEFYKVVRHAHSATGEVIGRAPANAQEWIVLAIGFVVSFLVAYAVVAWFMNWVRTRGFVPFAAYRIILGAAVLIWAMKHPGWRF